MDGVTILTTPVPAMFSSFLKRISTSSPTLILDLSMSLVSKTKLVPFIFFTWNLDDVLYIHEFAKICFLDLLICGLSIFSPTFLTLIFSPSLNNLISEVGLNSDKTPVNLNSTFLLKSPFS